MKTVSQSVREFLIDDSGLTAVEYAVAGGVIVGIMAALFQSLGSNATARIQFIVDLLAP